MAPTIKEKFSESRVTMILYFFLIHIGNVYGNFKTTVKYSGEIHYFCILKFYTSILQIISVILTLKSKYAHYTLYCVVERSIKKFQMNITL